MTEATTKGEAKPSAPLRGASGGGACTDPATPKAKVKALPIQPRAQAEASRKKLVDFGKKIVEWSEYFWSGGFFCFLLFCEAQMILVEMAASRHVLPSIRDVISVPVPYIMAMAVASLIVCLIGAIIYLRKNIIFLVGFIIAMLPMTLVALLASYFATSWFDTALGSSCLDEYECTSYATGGAEMSVLFGSVLILGLVGLSLAAVAGWGESWRDFGRKLEQESQQVFPVSAPQPRAPVVLDNILD